MVRMWRRFGFVGLVVAVVAGVVSASGGVSASPGSYRSLVLGDGADLLWEFDELAGTSAGDVAGGFAGTYSGSFLLGGTGATPGSSVEFNAGGGVVTAVDSSSLVGDELTAEVWFKPDGVPGDTQRLLRLAPFGYAIYWTPAGAVSAWAYLDDGTGSSYGSVSTLSAPVPSPTNDWIHVVFTVAGGTAALYVNGVLADDFGYSTSATSGVFESTASSFTVGADTNSYRSFAGEIDDVAIYDAALSASDVAAHYTATGRSTSPPVVPSPVGDYESAVMASSPIGYWRLDDPENNPGMSGEAALDVFGALPGTYSTAAVLLDQPGATGDGNTSVRFDNNNETVALSGTLVATDELSVELWFKSDGSPQAVQRLIRSRSNGFAIDWRPSTGTIVAWAYTSAGSYVSLESAVVSNNDWHHVVMTLNSVQGELWVDGVLEDVDANPTGGGLYSGSALVLGNDYNAKSGRNFIGWIDDLAIYHRTLGLDEIRGHYVAAGSPLPPAAVTSSATVSNCIAQGGNVYLDQPTVLEFNGDGGQTYATGCYYYETCISTMWPAISDLQSWSCDNQDLLLSVLQWTGYTAGATAAVLTCVGGGCALLVGTWPALAAETGAATVQLTTGTAATGALALAVEKVFFNSNDSIYWTQLDETSDPVPTLTEAASIFGGSGYGNGNGGEPIGPGEVCPPGSPREGDAIPEFGTGRWYSHIVTDHAAHLIGGSNPPGNSAWHPSFDSGEIGDLIRAIFCWGTRSDNPDTITGGYNYQARFVDTIGTSGGADAFVGRVTVNSAGEIWTAFPAGA